MLQQAWWMFCEDLPLVEMTRTSNLTNFLIQSLNAYKYLLILAWLDSRPHMYTCAISWSRGFLIGNMSHFVWINYSYTHHFVRKMNNFGNVALLQKIFVSVKTWMTAWDDHILESERGLSYFKNGQQDQGQRKPTLTCIWTINSFLSVPWLKRVSCHISLDTNGKIYKLHR